MFHPEGPSFFELARQGMSSLETGYDLLARKFDHTPFRTPDVLLERTFEGLGPFGDAVDLCCGTGAALRALRPRCTGRLVGVDLSRGMLAEAARVLEAPEVELVQGDVLAPQPAWGTFELATSFGAFGHILPRDEPALVRSVRALLRPGGRFVFVTADAPPPPSRASFWLSHGFNAAMRVRNALWRPPFVMYYLTFLLPRARALLEAQGFSLEVTRGLYPAPYAHGVRVVATAA